MGQTETADVSGTDETAIAESGDTPELPHPPPRRNAAPLQRRDPDRYEVLGEHGRGGLGTVSRARDKELGRNVAIKELIKRGDPGEQRFLREALITARLEHPGIVPIHEAGQWPDGTPFYVMKLVAGQSLKDMIADCGSVERRMGLVPHVIAVAEAVAYAHKRKIIHRDLKPANVIVGDFGETVVIDWGLAKDLSEPDDVAIEELPHRTNALDDLTATGMVLGTPLYMAPEQWRGEAVDQRADVFAIGAMLWELCSVHRVPPNEPDRRKRLLRDANVDPDLIAIIDKALDPDRERRYRDAGQLAADLRAFTSGARIASRRYSPVGIFAHWIRRHRALTIGVTSAVLLGLIGTVLFVQRVSDARDSAERARDDLQLQNAALLVEQDPTQAVAVLASYRGNDVVRRDRLEAHARALGVAELTMSPHGATVLYIVEDGGALFSISKDQTLRRTQNGVSTTLATDVRIDEANKAADYAPSRKLLAYARLPSGVSVLNVATLVTRTLPEVRPVHMEFNPDATQLATLSADGELVAWDLASASAIHRARLPAIMNPSEMTGARVRYLDSSTIVVYFDEHGLFAVSLKAPFAVEKLRPAIDKSHRFSARNGDLVIGEPDGRLSLLRGTSHLIAQLKVCPERLQAIRLAEEANVIAFACMNSIAGLAGYDVTKGTIEVLGSFTPPFAPWSARPDPLGRRVVVSGNSSTVYDYSLDTGSVTRLSGMEHNISFATPSLRGGTIAGDRAGNIRVWDAVTRSARVAANLTKAAWTGIPIAGGEVLVWTQTREFYRARLSDGHVEPLDGAPVSERSVDQSLRNVDDALTLWDPQSPRRSRVFNDSKGVWNATFLAGGRYVIGVTGDGQVLRWSRDSDERRVLMTRNGLSTAPAVVAQDQHVALHDASGTIFDVALDGTIKQIPSHGRIRWKRASRDGRSLLVARESGVVSVYDTTTYKVVTEVRFDSSPTAGDIDPSSRDFVVVTEAGQARLVPIGDRRRQTWRVSDLPASIARYSPDGQLALPPSGVGYSPDGERLAFICRDHSSWFYSFRDGGWVYARNHDTVIASGLFSPDGKAFVSVDNVGKVVVRDMDATFVDSGVGGRGTSIARGR